MSSETEGLKAQNRAAIQRSLRTILQQSNNRNGGEKVCARPPGRDFNVCYVENGGENGRPRAVETTVEDLHGNTLSHHHYSFTDRPGRDLVQVRSHLSTIAEEQSRGLASGLISGTNDVISHVIRAHPHEFEGKVVQGVIEDDATEAYRGEASMVGHKTGWSSMHAARLGYKRFLADLTDIPIWVKEYSVRTLSDTVLGLAKRLLRPQLKPS